MVCPNDLSLSIVSPARNAIIREILLEAPGQAIANGILDLGCVGEEREFSRLKANGIQGLLHVFYDVQCETP